MQISFLTWQLISLKNLLKSLKSPKVECKGGIHEGALYLESREKELPLVSLENFFTGRGMGRQENFTGYQ
jgi:hypothetical protein